MPAPSKFSIVIATYNRPTLFLRALKAIDRANEAGLCDEVVVVDDASSVDYGDISAQVCTPVKYLRLTENGGPCIARNAGIKLAKNDFVIILDDDDEQAVGGLEVIQQCLTAFEKRESYPMFYFATSQAFLKAPYLLVTVKDYMEGNLKNDFTPVIYKPCFLGNGLQFPPFAIGAENLLWLEVADKWGIPTWSHVVTNVNEDAHLRLTHSDNQIRRAIEYAHLQKNLLRKYRKIYEIYPQEKLKRQLGAATYYLLAGKRGLARKWLYKIIRQQTVPQALVLLALTFAPTPVVHYFFLKYRRVTSTVPTKKRICFVVSSAFSINAFLAKPILALAAKGWHVTLAVNAPADEVVEAVRQCSTIVQVDIVRPISPLQDLRGLWQLWRLFRRERFDIVHSMTPKAGLLAMLAAWLARVPKRFHTFTGQVWVTQQGVMRWLLRSLDKLLAACATALLTDSPSQREFLIAEGVVSAQRIQVLANGSVCGVDTQRFTPDAEIKQAVRAALHIPTDAKVLLFLGRLHPDKGIQELLQAFAKLAATYADLHLILAGPDEGAAEFIERFAAAYKALIHCTGLTREPERYMTAADIFCLPSYREGFGLSLLEAAATGLPSVATRIYGITDAVVDNVTGLLVPVRDAKALAMAIARLLNDPVLCQQLGTAARERAINEFSQEVLIKAWLDFYTTPSPLAGEGDAYASLRGAKRRGNPEKPLDSDKG